MQDYRDYKTIFNLTFNHNNKFLNLVSNTYINANGRTDKRRYNPYVLVY